MNSNVAMLYLNDSFCREGMPFGSFFLSLHGSKLARRNLLHCQMSFGRIHCFVVATKNADVLYERFFDRLSEVDKAEIRHVSILMYVSAPYLVN